MASLLHKIKAVAIWLFHRPAYMLLTAGDHALDAQPPERFRKAWLGLLLIAIAWAVLGRWLWWLSWKYLDDFLAFPIRTPAIVAAVILLWPMRQALNAASCLVGGRAVTTGSAAILMYIALAGGLMLLPGRFNDVFLMPDFLSWLRPDGLQYRVVALMPIWGWWAMLIVAKFCKPRENTSPAVAAMARGTGPLIATMGLAIPVLLTAIYFNNMGLRHLIISGCSAAVALAGGLTICKLLGGLSRNALVAANLLAQFALLGSCLACWTIYPA